MAQQSCFPAQGTQSTQDQTALICHQLAGYDFPWEMTRSLELAVLKTFCVPRVSQLLRQTGEFTQRPQKRYDDTTLILGNILKWGYDSPQGRAAIARMNAIHQRFNILNEDYLYVLSSAIYEPIRWNQRFGWRPFTEIEKQALYQFWRVVGQRMGITHIPETSAEFEAFNRAYESRHFQYHADNAVVGNAVIRLMTGWFPAIAAPLVPTVVKALVDAPTRRALGWSQPTPTAVWLLSQTFKIRRWLAPWLPQRQRANFVVDSPNLTYPQGYQIEQLGPQPLESGKSSSRCPFLKMRSYLKADL